LQEVEKAIDKMKNKRSVEVDGIGISSELVKVCKDELLPVP